MSDTNTIQTFDQIIATAQAGVDELLAQGRTDDANRKTYNLAADLAECWPGDDRPRERRHLEAGLAAAERCLAWRRELGKGPGPFAIAHWVQGAHLVALAHRAAQDRAALAARAVEALEESLRLAREVAGDDRDYLVITNTGFLAVARELAAPGTGRPALEEARAAFRAMAEAQPARREDVQYGLASLEVAVQRYLA